MPKDYTIIAVDRRGGNVKKVYYKDYSSYNRLPDVCKSPGVRREYEEYWKNTKEATK